MSESQKDLKPGVFEPSEVPWQPSQKGTQCRVMSNTASILIGNPGNHSKESRTVNLQKDKNVNWLTCGRFCSHLTENGSQEYVAVAFRTPEKTMKVSISFPHFSYPKLECYLAGGCREENGPDSPKLQEGKKIQCPVRHCVQVASHR